MKNVVFDVEVCQTLAKALAERMLHEDRRRQLHQGRTNLHMLT